MKCTLDRSRLNQQLFPIDFARLALIVCVLFAFVGFGLSPTSAVAQEATISGETAVASVAPEPTVTKPVYPVSSFLIQFDQDISALDLDVEAISTQPIRLSLVQGIYTRPQPGAELITTSLTKLKSQTPKQYDITALRAIIDDLLAYLGDEGDLVGIVVAPSPADIALDLTDRREDRTELTIVVRLAQVGRVRTLASGDRVEMQEREDNPVHDSLRARSPLQAGAEPNTGTFIQRTVLDEYLYRLNRHPGRRVDAAISPGLRPGEVSLDYLVAENKPWYVYFQLSNTGTRSTRELRERFGFVHNQLTGVDDILAIDYLTTGFEESHVAAINYRRPLTEYLTLRLNGLWSTFEADQVGSPLDFSGEDAAGGVSLAYNFFQKDALFIDAVGGLEYYFTSANNRGAGIEGEAQFLLANLGVEFDRTTDLSQVLGSIMLRGSLNQESNSDLVTLGRTAPSDQFLLLQYGLTTSFYLEPLINRSAWEDISDPSSSTLAHELAFAVRGQNVLDEERLVPTFQSVAGGLYTVRGYEEAEVAGDSLIVASVEYRFHIPRVFGISPPENTRLFDRPFRFTPDAVYGRADWDLVLKGFFDYAYVDNSRELAFETDETLMSTGLGIELAIKNNLNFRADWGYALEDAGSTQSGDSRLHFVFTLLY